MESTERNRSFFEDPVSVTLLVAAFKVVIFIVAGNSYGYFRDELYFLACADHLAWGYPDHAPLSVFITDFSRQLFGDSLYAIRLLPMLAGVVRIILTGLLVREFGGGRFAAFIACVCALIAPVTLAFDNLLSMNAYEPVFWMGCALSYVMAVRRGDSRYWLLFGALAGLGLMNKHSMVFFGAAIVIGLLVTKDRKFFADRNIWLAGAIAALIFVPNLIWQYQNNWATLELLRNVQTSGKNVVLSPQEFVFQQIFILLPFTAPVWIAGLWWLLGDREGRRYRTLGIAYLVTLVLMIALKAKNYYLAPVYPMLFAAGGVLWERLLDRFRFGRAAGFAYASVMIAAGLAFMPLAVPLLPAEKVISYQATLGIGPPKTEVGHQGPLPQHFGDMFGWEEMVAETAAVYNSLSPEEKAKAGIFASNYGEAGAVDRFGSRFGLPKAISTHQSYYLWGPRDYDGSVLIVLGSSLEDAQENCGSVEERTRVGHPLAMGEEHFNILICRNLKQPLPELWKKLKHWN